MQSNNPVFRRSEEFHAGGANAHGNQTYAGNGAAYQGYGADPSTWGTGTPGVPGQPTQAPPSTGPMTIDSVVQKTAISLGLVIVAAIAHLGPHPRHHRRHGEQRDLGPLFAAMTIGSLGAFGLSMVNSFKRVISPRAGAGVRGPGGRGPRCVQQALRRAVLDADSGNIVVQAVIGTFAAFAGTLAAYKFFNIQVGTKFRTFVIAAVFGMVGLSLMELVLSLFGAELGLFGFGALGLLFAIAGLVLGVFMLILDFDFVEQGIANGIPERESWRAAFAMTVSLVWIYTNLLRILAIFSDRLTAPSSR